MHTKWGIIAVLAMLLGAMLIMMTISGCPSEPPVDEGFIVDDIPPEPPVEGEVAPEGEVPPPGEEAPEGDVTPEGEATEAPAEDAPAPPEDAPEAPPAGG